jgi:DNA-directed RNA polymerase subunit RPC12/RpoP
MGSEKKSQGRAKALGEFATVKLYCRCGQKVRIDLPAPKPTGRCPNCGHVFVLPQPPLEFQRPAPPSSGDGPSRLEAEKN